MLYCLEAPAIVSRERGGIYKHEEQTGGDSVTRLAVLLYGSSDFTFSV